MIEGERVAFDATIAGLPGVLAETMLAAIDEPGVRIVAGDDAGGVCPVEAAADYADAHGQGPALWDPAWGTEAEFTFRVVEFVWRFDEYAELVGIDSAVRALKEGLGLRLADTASLRV